MQINQNRRRFLAGLAAGTAGLVAAPRLAFAEPPPETTKVRLPVFVNVSDCQSPMYIAEELLRAEGFTDISFVSSGTGPDSSDWLAHDEIDFDWNYPAVQVRSLANGIPIKVLAGMHGGCLELIAGDRVRGVLDLKGKRVGVDAVNGIAYLLLMIIIAYVGLDPTKDIQWVSSPDSLQDMVDGKIDAFLGGPPQPQEARRRHIGRVILNTRIDHPWSQYFCCMLSTSAAYVDRNPVATKRVLRAMLKAVDLCVSDPSLVARVVIAKGFATSYDDALRTMTDVRYDAWREFDPEDSMRFYALRLQETGMIRSSPQEIIANGTGAKILGKTCAAGDDYRQDTRAGFGRGLN